MTTTAPRPFVIMFREPGKDPRPMKYRGRVCYFATEADAEYILVMEQHFAPPGVVGTVEPAPDTSF